MNLFFKTFLALIFTLIISCKKSDPDEATLTHNQTQAMYWTDWAAGLAAAETGPISFGVAAGASATYYFNALPRTQLSNHVNFNSDSLYTNDFERLGVDHNSTCKRYINSGVEEFNFVHFKEFAKEVRPDLTEQIDGITSEYFSLVLSSIQNIDFADANSITKFIKNYVNLNATDEERIISSLNHLIGETDPNLTILNLNELIEELDSYSITNVEKTKLINSFSILKYSSQLWKP